MDSKPASPRILSIGWGKMDVENLGRGKDYKLWPGGGCEWDWKQNGTSHSRGIQVADVEELLNNGAQLVVLTRGMFLRLKVPYRVKQYLEDRGVEMVVASTKEGVKRYNECVDKGIPVAGLFHTTC